MRRLLRIGTVLVVLVVLAVLAVIASSCTLEPSTSVYNVKAGDCFDDPPSLEMGDEEVTDLPTIDCAGPHDNEVFGTFEVEDGPYPGEEALDDAAAACLPLFEDYVGAPLDDVPELDIFWIIPLADSWEGGDRTVTCALFDSDFQKLTGSRRGAGA